MSGIPENHISSALRKELERMKNRPRISPEKPREEVRDPEDGPPQNRAILEKPRRI